MALIKTMIGGLAVAELNAFTLSFPRGAHKRDMLPSL